MCAVKFGRANENKAKHEYAGYMKNTNRACKMYESDCVINPNCTWLAASPDGSVVQEDVEY